jgi:hypothetical protein
MCEGWHCSIVFYIIFFLITFISSADSPVLPLIHFPDNNLFLTVFNTTYFKLNTSDTLLHCYQWNTEIFKWYKNRYFTKWKKDVYFTARRHSTKVTVENIIERPKMKIKVIFKRKQKWKIYVVKSVTTFVFRIAKINPT